MINTLRGGKIAALNITGRGMYMILAKNNIIVKIAPSIKEKDRDEYKDDYDYAILNPVSGSFDIMDKNEYAMLKNLANASKPDDDFIAYLLERGYAYKDHNAEKATITQAQSRFEIEVNNSQIQLLLIPT